MRILITDTPDDEHWVPVCLDGCPPLYGPLELDPLEIAARVARAHAIRYAHTVEIVDARVEKGPLV